MELCLHAFLEILIRNGTNTLAPGINTKGTPIPIILANHKIVAKFFSSDEVSFRFLHIFKHQFTSIFSFLSLIIEILEENPEYF